MVMGTPVKKLAILLPLVAVGLTALVVAILLPEGPETAVPTTVAADSAAPPETASPTGPTDEELKAGRWAVCAIVLFIAVMILGTLWEDIRNRWQYDSFPRR